MKKYDTKHVIRKYINLHTAHSVEDLVNYAHHFGIQRDDVLKEFTNMVNDNQILFKTVTRSDIDYTEDVTQLVRRLVQQFS